VFPDGSRSLIPASWTDLRGQKLKKLALDSSDSIPNVIATTHHLLNTRKIVDALLCRINSSNKRDISYLKEGKKRAQANGTMAHITKIVPASKNLEDTDLSSKTKGHNRSGRPDQQNGLLREPRSESGGMS